MSIQLTNVRGLAIMGRILFDDDLHDLIPSSGTLGVDLSVVKGQCGAFLLQDQTLALIAIMRSTECGVVTIARGVERSESHCAASASPRRGWGSAFLAMSVALWIPVPYDRRSIGCALRSVSSRVGPLPSA